MQPKKSLLNNICLEKCKDGIIFIDGFPLFAKSENIAKQLQIMIWLDIPLHKDCSSKYIV